MMIIRHSLLLIILISICNLAVAEDPSTNNSSMQADLAQFQDWLKNNGQAQSSPTDTKLPHLRRHRMHHDQASARPLTYSQSKQEMLKDAPSDGLPIDPDATAAFQAMMQQNVPLSPQQIVTLRQLIDASQRAAAIPPTVPPKPVSSTLMVNLAPGATPPAIRLAQGYVTSLVFVDSAGSPWPIASFDIGNPKLNNLQWDGKSNVLLIQASAPYGDCDLVIRLVGLATPITLDDIRSTRRRLSYGYSCGGIGA